MQEVEKRPPPAIKREDVRRRESSNNIKLSIKPHNHAYPQRKSK